MINAVQTSIPRRDGSDLYLIVEPIIEKDGERGLRSTGIYKIFKDAFGEESTLIMEPLQVDEQNDDLPDEYNPDYLGKYQFDGEGKWQYQGNLLDPNEQAWLAEFIWRYEEPDI